MALKIMYTIFLALLVALFVGLGISAFYPAPKMPEYPKALERKPYIAPVDVSSQSLTPAPETTEEKKMREEFEDASDKYNKELLPRYNRNVSIASMIAAVIVLVISLVFVKRIEFLSDGLLLGGVLTLLYSVIRGFMGEDNRYRFAVVTVGLVVALILGYVKFIKPSENK